MTDLVSMIQMPEPKDASPPRLIMSLHKCGSTMMNGLHKKALKAIEFPSIDLPSAYFRAGVATPDWDNKPEVSALIRSGIVYTGFRELPRFMTADRVSGTRISLLVRDPRDALVSGFFSFGPKGSHVLPEAAKAGILATRALEADLDIDAWVIKHAPRFIKQFMAYAPFLNSPTVKMFRYEEVLFNKLEFLTQSFVHLGLPILPFRFGKIVDREPDLPEVEDPSKHIRKGTPGDHNDKLSPDTLTELNGLLAEVLKIYGYQ